MYETSIINFKVRYLYKKHWSQMLSKVENKIEKAHNKQVKLVRYWLIAVEATGSGLTYHIPFL